MTIRKFTGLLAATFLAGAAMNTNARAFESVGGTRYSTITFETAKALHELNSTVEKHQEISTSVMSAMSGVKFFFAPEDKFSAALSGGNFNSKYSFGGGIAWRTSKNFMLNGSGAVHLDTKDYALNVGMTFSF